MKRRHLVLGGAALLARPLWAQDAPETPAATPESLYDPTRYVFIGSSGMPQVAVVDLEAGRQTDTIRIPVAAFLLMLPGFFSDLIALLLLLPLGGAPGPNSQQQNPFNSHNPFAQSPFTRGSGDDGDIIEGDFVVRDGKPQRQPENKHQPDLIEHKK